MSSTATRDSLFILLALALALALRLDLLLAGSFSIEADEAIVGLMALHIKDGADFPVFYYGQHYMGSLEAFIVSGFFKIFGVSNAALKAVPLLFALGVSYLAYLLGNEIGGRKVARLALLFSAVAPSQYVVWSVKARGGFIELVFIGSLALLFTIRNLKRSTPSAISTALIGMLLGLGWWVNNQVVYFTIPIGLAYLLRFTASSGKGFSFKEFGLHFSIGVAAFLVGGLPYWIYNLQHNFISFELFSRARTLSVQEQLAGLAGTALPILLGARRLWHDTDVYAGATFVTFAVYGIVAITVLYSRVSALLALPKGRLDVKSPVELFIALVVSALVIFSLSSFGHLAQEPRYLLPVNVALFVLTAYGISKIWQRYRPLAFLLTLAVLSINIASSYLGGRAIPGEPFVYENQRVSKDHTELISWLKSRGFPLVRTNYWIGYRLAFETAERIKFLITQKPYETRIPAYREEAINIPRDSIPYVLVPNQARRVESALSIMGYRYRVATPSAYRVIYDIAPGHKKLNALSSGNLLARASIANSEAAKALDGDIATRWGSGSAQTPNMIFEVLLKEPRKIRALRYDLGAWAHDYPRGLTIDIITKSHRKKRLLDGNRYGDVRYFMENDSSMFLYFRPVQAHKVVLTQSRSHQVFDWSIAEFTLFE